MNDLLIRLTDSSQLGDHFIPGASFIPESSTDEAELRKTLIGDTDPLSTLVILRTIDAFSYLRSMVYENNRTYDTLLTSTPSFVLDSVDQLVPDLQGRVGINRAAGEWPLITKINISNVDDVTAKITLGVTGVSSIVNVSVDSSVWTVEWPAWSGVSGRLYCPDGFSEVSLQHKPTSVPFGLLRDRITDLGWTTLSIINEEGLLELFNRTPSAEEAVAVAAVALIKHNNDVVFVD